MSSFENPLKKNKIKSRNGGDCDQLQYWQTSTNMAQNKVISRKERNNPRMKKTS